MSMNSGLIRDKHGVILRDGKPADLTCHTGDDTPVIQDERLDVDLNRLVSNEMARQETMRIPGATDFHDLTDFPVSRGDAEVRSTALRIRLRNIMASGETLEQALIRVQGDMATLQTSLQTEKANTPQNAPQSPPEPATPQTALPPKPNP